MRKGQAIWACVCATVLCALMPSAASAARGGGERLYFRLEATHGYKIHGLGHRATGALVVTRGRHRRQRGLSGSIYLARADTGGDRFEATFGDLGRVDVRFRPSGRIKLGKRHRLCRGPDHYTTHYGTFVGAVRFRGEDAYAAAKARRVKGMVVRPAVLDCLDFLVPRSQATFWRALTSPSTALLGVPSSVRRVSTADLRSPPRLPPELRGGGRRTVLRADWRQGVAVQAFGAIRRGRRRPVFAAGIVQARERYGVVRLAAAIGSRAGLLASDSLGTATVSPPPPFSGDGLFRHFDDGTKSWTGSLAVSFPGETAVPLTGPQFEVGLSRGF